MKWKTGMRRCGMAVNQVVDTCWILSRDDVRGGDAACVVRIEYWLVSAAD
jgi:hypothetical protein